MGQSTVHTGINSQGSKKRRNIGKRERERERSYRNRMVYGNKVTYNALLNYYYLNRLCSLVQRVCVDMKIYAVCIALTCWNVGELFINGNAPASPGVNAQF